MRRSSGWDRGLRRRRGADALPAAAASAHVSGEGAAALDKKVTVSFGTFDNCLQVKDWSSLAWTSEYKYFCPGAGFAVLEEPALLKIEKTELTAISSQ